MRQVDIHVTRIGKDYILSVDTLDEYARVTVGRDLRELLMDSVKYIESCKLEDTNLVSCRVEKESD